jgi:aminopeptidase-like protein
VTVPAAVTGARMKALIDELYPIPRSITGDGLRRTLRRIGTEIPLAISEVPSGTQVLDWTVPREWNIRDAWIANAGGDKVVDFQAHSLHVVGYSVPVRERLSLRDLRAHLHSLPAHPDWIPYRTSYYREQWGFCLPHRTLVGLDEGEYEVCIDSTLEDGSLTYAECVVPGEQPDEILISCHCCHPSLANDNLSGIATAIELARDRLARPGRFTYRFLFIPGTIGAIAWLARNRETVGRIRAGFVLSGVGYGRHTYKRSRRGNAMIDRAFASVLRHTVGPHEVRDFTPYGYDERQYCSPGFDLPVGCLMGTPFGEYSEYHTSADTPALIDAERLLDTVQLCRRVFDVIEGDERLRNLQPYGEPQLGRRGLYRTTGGDPLPGYELALLWVLNLSDGSHSLLDIAERANLTFSVVRKAADALRAAELLASVTAAP